MGKNAEPTILVDQGKFLAEELREIVSDDIDTLKSIALRWRGISTELGDLAAAIEAGAIEHVRDADDVLKLCLFAVGVPRAGATAVSLLRDFAENLAAHEDGDLDDEDDVGTDEEE